MPIRKPDSDRGPFGARLHRRRSELGLSQKHVAQEIGVSTEAYRQWEAGKVPQPRPDNLARAAEVLQTSPQELLTGHNGVRRDALEELRDEIAAVRRQLADLVRAQRGPEAGD